MKKKGFTLIELLAVIVILAVIALIATPIILGIIEDTKKNAFKDTAYGISGAAKNKFIEMMYAGVKPIDIVFTYTNGVLSSTPSDYTLNFEGQIPQNGEVRLDTSGKVALALHDGKYCVIKEFNDADVTIEELSLDECLGPAPVLVDESGANAPVLAIGMTAVRWDGTNWVNATNINDSYKQDWYDYGEKKWANAKTADGSYWVWIPRYAYQIQSNYHTATAGMIDIIFLNGVTDTPTNSVAITLGSAPTYTGNAQTNYVRHPSFWWDNDSDGVQDTGEQLTGFWVAKFEPSGTSTALDSKPNVTSYRNLIGANMFTYTRNMETNARYGWGTSGVGVDTHMMKNMEWGAVAYLSKATYGKSGEVTPNTSSGYYTGGGTGNAYITNIGQSTTGNIYGIYDMAGGGDEYVMGNYNNVASSSGLTPSTISNKYIDRYTNIYSNAKYGDAVYETSSTNSGAFSWYNDHSVTASNMSSNPWFLRGYYYGGVADSGMFSFETYGGGGNAIITWRICLVVGNNL